MNVERLRDDGPFRQDLERDLSLHNDVLFSLPTVCQLVIDIACGAWSNPRPA